MITVWELNQDGSKSLLWKIQNGNVIFGSLVGAASFCDGCSDDEWLRKYGDGTYCWAERIDKVQKSDSNTNPYMWTNGFWY